MDPDPNPVSLMLLLIQGDRTSAVRLRFPSWKHLHKPRSHCSITDLRSPKPVVEQTCYLGTS